jgi:hypothetical protein
MRKKVPIAKSNAFCSNCWIRYFFAMTMTMTMTMTMLWFVPPIFYFFPLLDMALPLLNYPHRWTGLTKAPIQGHYGDQQCGYTLDPAHFCPGHLDRNLIFPIPIAAKSAWSFKRLPVERISRTN